MFGVAYWLVLHTYILRSIIFRTGNTGFSILFSIIYASLQKGMIYTYIYIYCGGMDSRVFDFELILDWNYE